MCRLFLSYVRGDWPKWFLIGVWAPTFFILTVTLLVLSSTYFSGGYDWRYQTMCSLSYSHLNPVGHIYWSWALFLVCASGLPCAGYFRARLRHVSPRLCNFSAATLRLGLCCGIIVSFDGILLPKLNMLFFKLHEIMATVTFAAIFLGVMGFWVAMMKWLRTDRLWGIRGCAALSLAVVVPFAGAMISQAYLFFVPNDLGWVDADWAAKGVPLYLSFAFWEWLATVGIYISMFILAVILPTDEKQGSVGSAGPHLDI